MSTVPQSTDPTPLLQHRLHQGPRVALHDVCCQPRDFGRGPEELAQRHQLVFPRRGVFEREVRGERVLADANRVLFFNRDESYRVSHPARCGDECTALTLSDDLVREALAVRDPDWAEQSVQPFRFSHARPEPALLAAVERLRGAARAPHGESLALEEAALALLNAVLDAAYRQRALAPRRCRDNLAQRDKVHETALLLATRFADDLSLEQIGRAVHCSSFHLARLFRAHTGLSLHQYRHRLRLREALRRIAEERCDLTRLALELGFSSHSHLSDSVRVAFGCAPSALRAQLSTQRLAQLSRILEVAPSPGAMPRAPRCAMLRSRGTRPDSSRAR